MYMKKIYFQARSRSLQMLATIDKNFGFKQAESCSLNPRMEELSMFSPLLQPSNASKLLRISNHYFITCTHTRTKTTEKVFTEL